MSRNLARSPCGSGGSRERSTTRVRSASLLVSFAIALAALSTSAFADWRRDYQFGEEAIDKGQWAEAEQLMKSALAEEPAAAAKKRFQGTRFALYAPAHYAGVAAFRQGACGRALGYLDDAANRALEAQVASLASESNEIRGKCGGSAVATAPVEPPKPPVEAPTPPKPTPVETRPVVEAPKPPPIPVTAPIATPTPAPAAPTAAPAALRTILAAYLAGNYDAAVKVGDGGIGDARAHAFLLLVRAAAWHTRSELRGGDPAMLASAEADLRASRRLARLDLDPNLFSPKLRALAAKTR